MRKGCTNAQKDISTCGFDSHLAVAADMCSAAEWE